MPALNKSMEQTDEQNGYAQKVAHIDISLQSLENCSLLCSRILGTPNQTYFEPMTLISVKKSNMSICLRMNLIRKIEYDRLSN